MGNKLGKPVSQRQLRVGEMIKQSLGMIFVRNEAKVPNLETNSITVTEVKMSQDLKIAKAYVLPLGGQDAEEKIKKLKEYSFLVRKILSKNRLGINLYAIMNGTKWAILRGTLLITIISSKSVLDLAAILENVANTVLRMT